jgi:indole-3-glycerol phosphate synthase
MAFLDEILKKKHQEILASKQKHKIGDLVRMFKSAPPVRPFAAALTGGFGLIAEVKRKSPSAGPMRNENVQDAPEAYDKSPIVKAVSVLTDSHFFGMSIEELRRIKSQVRQPVLRKDFIVKEYQVYEARAYGADAVLIMANVLNRDEMRRIYDLVREVGMQAIFEAHTEEEIESIPDDAVIYGLNSRKFMAVKRWAVARLMGRMGLWRSANAPDPSIDSSTFNLVRHLPKHAIKVAESGVRPNRIASVRDLNFDAVLVGTSLLKDARGIHVALSEFEKAIQNDSHLFSASGVRSANPPHVLSNSVSIQT